MKMNPCCVKCKKEMKVTSVGVLIQEMLDGHLPYKLWSADLYSCSTCNFQILCPATFPFADYNGDMSKFLHVLTSTKKKVFEVFS
jgi:hypothetical protein